MTVELVTTSAPSEIAPPSRRRGRCAALWAAIVLAAALIFTGDRMLRRRENLVATILSRDVPALLPFSDYLFEHASRKTEWHEMLRKLAAARAAGDRETFIKTTYDLSKFASSNLGNTDRRRQAFLLELVNRYGDDPQTISAYLDLFERDWRDELHNSYPAYTEALLRFAANDHDPRNADLALNVAHLLRERQETALELRVLRHIRETGPINVYNADAMQRLAELLPAGDPDLRQLTNDLAEHRRRREQLVASSKWYNTFEAARAKGDLAGVQGLRAAAPRGAVNVFIASADAHLAQQYLWLGRFPEAENIRQKLAAAPPPRMDDTFDQRMLMAMMPVDPMARTAPHEPPAMPDLYAIGIQRWRGLLDSGKYDQAAAQAKALFANVPEFATAADAETRVQRGDISNLSPVASLEPADPGDVPKEMAGQAGVSRATLELHPAGAAVDAAVRAWADLWVSDRLVVIDVHADEPRAALPPPPPRERDGQVYKDECVEIFFNPDRWLDFYYQIDVNSAGAIFDARMINVAGTHPHFNADTHLNLDVTATATRRPGGWGAHVVLSRAQVIPPGPTVARFNIRRFRFVEISKQSVLQIYTWAPIKDGDHHPEQFGWIVLPAERK